MSAYYNEFDPFAANWLEELIKDGLIAPGVVDRRSITEVDPNDLKDFAQCHFFTGIGGWSLAARLAGWPDDRPMWTGSPPCQPFSTAGNRKGKDDTRHLWPVFFNLIHQCRPSTVFGEQVASAIRMGWFDDLQADLEAENYASGMVVLPACSVGAPHKRDRLFYFAKCLADTSTDGRGARPSEGWSGREWRQSEQGRSEVRQDAGDGSASDKWVADSDDSRQPRQGQLRRPSDTAQDGDREVDRVIHADSFSSFWEGSYYVYCRDGKHRQIPTEPALFPLAHGIPNRVGALRGAGNAIVPQVGAEVIRAFMELDHA